jgi:hypothetical protein
MSVPKSTAKWYEVWADDGLPTPYILLVVPAENGGAVIIDPREECRVVYSANDYEAAKLWLLEDEYIQVVGRMGSSE